MRIYYEKRADGTYYHAGLHANPSIHPEPLPGAIESSARLELITRVRSILDKNVKGFQDDMLVIIEKYSAIIDDDSDIQMLAKTKFLLMVPMMLSLIAAMVPNPGLTLMTLRNLEERCAL